MSQQRVLLNVDAPSGMKNILIEPGLRRLPLTEVLRRHGLPLNTRCGQHRVCDGCIIDLLEGQLAHVQSTEPLSPRDGQPVSLRACEYRISAEGPLSIRIPARSTLAYEPQVLTDYRINVPYAHHPLWQQVVLEAAAVLGAANQGAALVESVSRHTHILCPIQSTPRAIAECSRISSGVLYAALEYRSDHWAVTSVSDRPHDGPLGAAIDIGTTTMVLLLVDLKTGKILSRAADFNQQFHLGDDVVTRITLCTKDPSMVRRLQHAVADETIAPLLREALAGAGLPADRSVDCYAIAGNTTMLHLAAGVDPSPMGVAPFTAPFLEHKVVSSTEIFHDSPLAGKMPVSVHLLPSAAAYIGSDLTAGILASGLAYDDGPSLLVDVGTNGEIIFKHGNKLLACATAAGPAFEGAGLSCGMRAGDGAISYIEMTSRPFSLSLRRIGSVPHPAGLCGSAYVDFLSEARRVGLLSPMGRFDLETCPDAAPHIIPWPSEKSPHDRALKIAEAQGSRPIVISESDIASLLASKAAIAAGILTLLNRAGVQPSHIKRLYLAGGFGTHMKAAHAIGCGLLPGFTPDQILAVGNTSVAGALLSLLDSSALDEIARIAKRIEMVELNLDPEFEGTYIDQMTLPDVA